MFALQYSIPRPNPNPDPNPNPNPNPSPNPNQVRAAILHEFRHPAHLRDALALHCRNPTPP
eukprot:scaffold70813_cov33-Phaeocystis_antarctica.AAC.1